MRTRLLLIVCLGLSLSNVARAQWIYQGTPIAATLNLQQSPSVAPDGSGGAIITWYDSRSGFDDIYAQRINSSGVALWAADGVVICNAVAGQYEPKIVPDGAGGAVIAWYDQRLGNNDIYAQRINSAGVVQWTANGVAICTAGQNQSIADMVSDGGGGAIMTWIDQRALGSDIYARRITAAGTPQWAADGVAICTAASTQDTPSITTDGAGGAIIVWPDWRTGTADIYAQRVNNAGALQWLANGAAYCTSINTQVSSVIASDGAGGATFVWQDNRAGNTDIYAQRVSSVGAPLWLLDGAPVCTDGTGQFTPHILWDNAVGAIFTWTDNRGGTSNDVYAQRFNFAGAPQWTFNGIPISATTGSQTFERLVSAGPGAGAVIAWNDTRSGNQDVYAQRISPGGIAAWTTNGVPVSTADGIQYGYVALAGDNAGGTIVAWTDGRTGGYDLFAQRIEGQYGYWGKPEPTLNQVRDVPADQGGKVKVNWAASQRDVAIPRTVSYYTIWRAIDNFAANLTLESSHVVRDFKDVREDMAGPVYVSVPPYYWEKIGTQSAHGYPAYSFTASTLADSVASNASNAAFMVAAHISGDDYVAFTSNALTGHSVDNLAPPAPLFLTALRVGADVHLEWNRVRIPDLDNYQVYRATSSGVTPIPPNFLTNDDDTLLVDASAPTTALYYIVTAKDVHGNQGVASNEASVSPTTGAGNTPPITALTVLQNHPNPFSGETALQVGLPGAADVSVEIYDVAGRRVREQSFARQAKGWSTLRLDSRDRNGALLPSGVYFYRVRAGGEIVTNKMVIAR